MLIQVHSAVYVQLPPGIAAERIGGVGEQRDQLRDQEQQRS